MNRVSVTFLGAVIFLLPALYNGAPLFYFDTPAYLQGADKAMSWVLSLFSEATAASGGQGQGAAVSFGDNGVQSGRSIYYGFFAWLGWQSTLWLPVMVQALTLSWLVTTLIGTVFAQDDARFRAVVTLVVIAILTVLTPASAFANLIMPDIWAGLLILACAILWAAPKPTNRLELLGLWAVLAFAAISHTSHLLLLAMFVVAGAIWFVLGKGLKPYQIALPTFAVLLAVFGQFLFGFAIERVSGNAPLARPHITAHLVDLGPGTRYALSTCPESGYAICDHVDKLPTDWIDFLFSTEPEKGVFAVSSVEEQRILADEQTQFVIGTLRSEPLATIGGLMYDGIAQLWTLSVLTLPQSEQTSDFLLKKFPADLVALVQQSRIYGASDWIAAWSWLIHVVAAVSAAILLCLMVVNRHSLNDRKLLTILSVLLGGVLLNALICGALASPYGRFQARVVWIVTLASCLWIANHFRRRVWGKR